MFSIYINDLSCFLTCNICDSPDDTTIYVYNSSLQFVLEKLEEHYALAMKWFKINEMKMNADKCHLFVCGANLNKCRLELETI